MKKFTIKFLILSGLYLFSTSAYAQNSRVSERNNIGWMVMNTSVKIHPEWKALLEYQFRRTHLGEEWQQSLLRTGIQYQAGPQVRLRAGYAWVETFPYGRTHLNSQDLVFPEHRLYQGLLTEASAGRVKFLSRYMLEERFIGKSLQEDGSGFDYLFAWRGRAQVRAESDVSWLSSDSRRTYIAIWDEVMIGFGKHVNQNIFDQNRLALVAGYQPGKHFKIEGGFFEQIVQVGREINNHEVFQHNTGFNLAANFDF